MRATRILAAAAALSLVVASSAVAAAPMKDTSYEHGTLGDEVYVLLDVSRRGGRLADVSVAMDVTCSNGRKTLGLSLWFAGLGQPAQIPIGRDGRFSAALAEHESLNPFAVSEEYWLSGRFIRRGRAARVTVRTRLVGEAGTVCDTGERQ
jgi:hypothetical protein